MDRVETRAWFEGLRRAERRIQEERRAHPVTPSEALRQADELYAFARGLGRFGRDRDREREDARVRARFAKLAHASRGR